MKKPTLERLTREVVNQTNYMSSASLGLLAIAELLGADDQGHDLGIGHRNGLAHAVYALARSIQDSSNGLYFVVADEGGEQ